MTREEINKYVEIGDIKYGEEITTERAIAEVYRWIRVIVGESYDYEILTPKVLDMVIQALSEKTAEWVYRGNGIICSNCKEKIPYGIHNHYCRNCGAKMVGK